MIPWWTGLPNQWAGMRVRSSGDGWLSTGAALAAKCEGFTPEEMVERSAPPSAVSMLGLIRHLSEMEREYVQFALRGGELDLRYCATSPEADMEGIGLDDVEPSLAGRCLSPLCISTSRLCGLDDRDDSPRRATSSPL